MRKALAGTDVSAHRARALLNPPANRPFAGVIGAIQLLIIGATPFARARQPVPQVEADPETTAADDRLSSDALPLATWLADSAGTSLPIPSPALVVDS